MENILTKIKSFISLIKDKVINILPKIKSFFSLIKDKVIGRSKEITANKENIDEQTKKVEELCTKKVNIKDSSNFRKILFWLFIVVVILLNILFFSLIQFKIISFITYFVLLWILIFETAVAILLIIVNILKKKKQKKPSPNLMILESQIEKIELLCDQKYINFKKLSQLLIIGENSKNIDALLSSWKYQNNNDEKSSLSKLCKIWFSRTSIIYSLKHESDDECRLIMDHICHNKRENAINAVIVTISCKKLLNSSNEYIVKFSKTISNYIQTIQKIELRRIPVYFLFTDCDDIVGMEEYFSVLSQFSVQEILGYTSKQKNDENLNFDLIYDDLDNFISNLEVMREKLLHKIKPPIFPEKMINYTDSFFPFTYKIKNIIGNFKKILSELVLNHQANNLIFPFRGIYFVSKKRVNDSLSQNTSTNKKDFNNSTNNMFNLSVIDKIITKESKTITPISKNYYHKRKTCRIFFSLIVFFFLILLFFSFNGFFILQNETNLINSNWKETTKSNNWQQNMFLPILGIRISSAGEVSQLNFDNLPREKNNLTLIHLSNGKTVAEYVNSLFISFKDKIQYPFMYKIYKYINFTNIRNKEKLALNILYDSSFLYPLLRTTLYTYFTEPVTPEEATFNVSWILMKRLKLITGSTKMIPQSKESFYEIYYDQIFKFLYKYNEEQSLNLNKLEQLNKGIYSSTAMDDSLPKKDELWRTLLQKSFDYDDNELKFLFTEKIYSILHFPLVIDNFTNKYLTYDEMKNAELLLKTLLFPLLPKKTKLNGFDEKLVNWGRDSIILANTIDGLKYKKTKNILYLQNYNITQTLIKNTNMHNVADLFISAQFVSGEKFWSKEITRRPFDIVLGTINNDKPSSNKILFFESNLDAGNEKPACVLTLPDYWTALHLLFDGPKLRSPEYKYPYWGTWDAAVHIETNTWQSRLRFIGKDFKEYVLFLKFTLDDDLAKAVLKLNDVYKNKRVHTEQEVKNNKDLINLSKENQTKKTDKAEVKSEDEKKIDNSDNKELEVKSEDKKKIDNSDNKELEVKSEDEKKIDSSDNKELSDKE